MSVDNRTPEQKAQDEVALAATSLDMRLLRNNRGALLDKQGRPVRFGLGHTSKKDDDFKSSDLIGGCKVTITPEMVGKTVFILTAVEVKPEGWQMPKNLKPSHHEYGQLKFLEWVIKMGGFGGFARNAADVAEIYNHFISWLKS